MLYVIHLDGAMRMDARRSARHYIGFVDGPERLIARMALHRSGRGSKFLRAANEYGIGWRLVAVYRGERTDERRLKDQNNSVRFCPECVMNVARNPAARAAARRQALGLPGTGLQGPAKPGEGLEACLRRLGIGHLYEGLREYT